LGDILSLGSGHFVIRTNPDQPGERRSEGPPPVLDSQLYRDATLDGHLIEITRAGVIWISLAFFLLSITLVEYVVVNSSNIFFDFAFVQRVEISFGVGLTRTSDELVPWRFASYKRLRGQDRALVLKWGRCCCDIVSSIVDVRVSEASHGRVSFEPI